MADKAPVQDKLSKILAELLWSVAGTEEEDEYAGEVYMQMQDDCGDQGEEDGGSGVGCDDDDDDDDDDDGVFEDADGDTMEIVEMSGNCSDDDDDDKEDAEGEVGEDQTNGSEDEEEEVGEEQQRIRDMNEKHCRGAHLVSLYISTFLCTVRREWGNVDKHRVDKFYTAVRFMISEVCYVDTMLKKKRLIQVCNLSDACRSCHRLLFRRTNTCRNVIGTLASSAYSTTPSTTRGYRPRLKA